MITGEPTAILKSLASECTWISRRLHPRPLAWLDDRIDILLACRARPVKQNGHTGTNLGRAAGRDLLLLCSSLLSSLELSDTKVYET